MSNGMNHEWHTARELAALNLPGMPTTRQGIMKRAEAEAWQTRDRQGRGGGMEYHSDSLPQEARLELIERYYGGPKTAEENTSTSVIAEPISDKKLSARLLILSALELYRVENGYSLRKAVPTFIYLYNNHALSNIPQWVTDLFPSLSDSSLWRWHQHKKEKRLYDLKSTQNNRKNSGILDRAEKGTVKEFIGALIISQPHLTSGHIRDLVRAKYGNALHVVNQKTGTETMAPLPDMRTFRRFISGWVKSNADLFERATNPDGFKNKRQMAIGKADDGIVELNQQWQIDASPADVLCEDGRYSLYALIDVWSRRAIFTISKTAKTEGALALLRKAIMEWGVPQSLKTDNGSDFTSHRFVQAVQSLGIEQLLCRPFTPEGKPFVERVIKTVQHDLMATLPGYIGHSVKDRKQIESRKAFAVRLGESDAKTFAIKMTHKELQDNIDRWANDKYAHRPHNSLNGMSPFNKASSSVKPIQRIENVRALDLLLAPLAGSDGIRTVGKKGLRIANGHFYGVGLELYVGKRVFVRQDVENMGRVYVFDEESREFICEAINIERDGVQRTEAATYAKAAQKQFIKEQMATLNREKRKITPERIAEDILSLHSADNGNLAAFPKRTEQYSTDALTEAGTALFNSGDAEILKRHAQPKQVTTLDDDVTRWMKNYHALIKRQEDGEDLSVKELKWLAWAEDTHWFKAQTNLEEMRNAGA